MCADLGITPEVREDHASYIASWLKVLKDDKRFIFSAASHAQRDADYLHGLQPKKVEEVQAAALPEVNFIPKGKREGSDVRDVSHRRVAIRSQG